MSIRVFFATNRGGDLPPRGSDRSRIDALRFGEAQVEQLGDPLRTESGRRIIGEVRLTGALSLAEALPAPAAVATLSAWFAAAGADGVPLLFLHGFANGFEDALKRAAQIVEFYGDRGLGVRLVPLVLSWPSLGRTIGSLSSLRDAEQPYHDDQAAAEDTGPALARLLQEILHARRSAGEAGRRLTLLAHSMGNYVLLNGLQSLGDPSPDDHGAFRHALEMAADVDWQAWAPGAPLRRLALLAEQVTIGTSIDPVVHTVSGIANHGGSRLGYFGPRDLATLPSNVAVLDCGPGLELVNLSSRRDPGGTEWDRIGHQYYRNDRNVRAHLTALFRGASAGAPGATCASLDPAQRWSGGEGPGGAGGEARGRTHALLRSIQEVAEAQDISSQV